MRVRDLLLLWLGENGWSNNRMKIRGDHYPCYTEIEVFCCKREHWRCEDVCGSVKVFCEVGSDGNYQSPPGYVVVVDSEYIGVPGSEFTGVLEDPDCLVNMLEYINYCMARSSRARTRNV